MLGEEEDEVDEVDERLKTAIAEVKKVVKLNEKLLRH